MLIEKNTKKMEKNKYKYRTILWMFSLTIIIDYIRREEEEEIMERSKNYLNIKNYSY